MIESLVKHWRVSVDKFSGNPVSFNFRQVVSTCLGEKRSDVYTHYIHSYPAKMFPYIPMFLLSIPELCPCNGVALDPFCGSGTVLLESIVHPIYKRNVFGTEINPLARLISKVKTTPLDEVELKKRISHLFEQVENSNSKESSIPKSEKIPFWFSKKAIEGLGKLKFLIEHSGEDDDYKDFFWVCFSSVIRKFSKADPFIPPPVLLKLEKYDKSPEKYALLTKHVQQGKNPDIISSFRGIVERNFLRIIQLNKINAIKRGQVKAQIIWDDVRSIKVGKLKGKGMLDKKAAKVLPSGSIDFIITSPPYLTAQKYIRTQRLELLWLGFSEDSVSSLQKSLIGTERISLSAASLLGDIGVEKVDSIIRWSSSSPHRAAELAHYYHAMNQAISEMNRVLRNGAYAAIVLGNNRVLGKNLESYKLLIDIASVSGFSLKAVLKDKIRGRGMITRRHNTGGLIEDEFIVILRKEEENVQNN